MFGSQPVPGMNNNNSSKSSTASGLANGNIMGNAFSKPAGAAGIAGTAGGIPKPSQPMGPNYSRSFFPPQQVS